MQRVKLLKRLYKEKTKQRRSAKRGEDKQTKDS